MKAVILSVLFLGWGVLVALKTAIDVRAHMTERRKFGAQDTPSPLETTGAGAA